MGPIGRRECVSWKSVTGDFDSTFISSPWLKNDCWKLYNSWIEREFIQLWNLNPFLWTWDVARLLEKFSQSEKFSLVSLNFGKDKSNLQSLLKSNHSEKSTVRLQNPKDWVWWVEHWSHYEHSKITQHSQKKKYRKRGFQGLWPISPQIPLHAPFIPAPGWPLALEEATLNFRC